MAPATTFGYVAVPPDDAERVVWPETFGTRFSIFVDTEEEFDWGAPLKRDRHATTAVAALPEAHAFFAGHDVPLAYMIDYPIATDPRAAAILRGLVEQGATVGTQLHAWVNPPFDEPLTPANSYAGNLGLALEAAKLDALTDAIVAATGVRPIAYRAGRYGLGPDTLALLAARGYRLDSSMRARYDYRADGGPDFRAIGNHAFVRDGMIELPLTTVFTGALRGRGIRLYERLGMVPRGRGLASRLHLLSRIALTPEDMPLAAAREAVAVAVGEGVRVLNFAFHSPSLEPGHTPYVRDAADLAAFYRWWETILTDLATRGVRAASVAQLISAVDRSTLANGRHPA